MKVYKVESKLRTMIIATKKDSFRAEQIFKGVLCKEHATEYQQLISRRSKHKFVKDLIRKYSITRITRIDPHI